MESILSTNVWLDFSGNYAYEFDFQKRKIIVYNNGFGADYMIYDFEIESNGSELLIETSAFGVLSNKTKKYILRLSDNSRQLFISDLILYRNE